MKPFLCVIPARGGSKGIPDKNIKLLCGMPLIHYTIHAAREVFDDADIIVSTDSEDIKSVAESTGLYVPFLRPAELATDESGSHEVLIHCLQKVCDMNRAYKSVVLLQPTSPFRTANHIKQAMQLYDENDDNCEMLVSVTKAKSNPFFNQYIEKDEGFLKPLMSNRSARRQDCPAVFSYNGAIYIIKAQSLIEKHLHALDFVRKYLMDDLSSLDIDTPFDWMVAESLVEKWHAIHKHG